MAHRLSSRGLLPRGLFVIALAIFAAPAVAQSAGDVAAGKKVTEFLCRNCHDVSGNERPKSPPGGAPAFFDLAQMPGTTAEKTHKFLHLPTAA